MAKKEIEALPRPKLDPPVNTSGKVNIIVSGSMEVKSDDSRIVVERNE